MVKHYDRKTRNTVKARKPKQVPEPSPNVPPFIQQAVAQGRKLGVVLLSYRARRVDRDNLTGGGKPWIDALRYAGYLRDDDPDSVEAFYLQRPSSLADERTEIYVFVL